MAFPNCEVSDGLWTEERLRGTSRVFFAESTFWAGASVDFDWEDCVWITVAGTFCTKRIAEVSEAVASIPSVTAVTSSNLMLGGVNIVPQRNYTVTQAKESYPTCKTAYLVAVLLLLELRL